MKNEISAKKWLFVFAVLFLFFFMLVGIINYLIDPYGLNNFMKVEKLNEYKRSNTGYTFRFKTNVFNNNEFDTIMLGTSRVGVMDPSVVNELLDAKTFNFASSGSITEIQRDLFFYAVNNKKIKNVIYGIDFLSLNGTITLENKFKEFCQVQEKIKSNKALTNYDLYFNSETLSKSYEVVMKNLRGKGKVTKHYRADNGMRDYVDYIEELKAGTFEYDKEINYSLKSYYSLKRKGGYQNYKLSDKYFEYIREIVTYCKEHNIRLWVYIPPMDAKHFDGLLPYGIYNEFEEFKRRLLGIVDYVDFTGHNSINDNHENYWEGSHLKKELTPLVMAKILNKTLENIPADFGVHVKSNNIEQHLRELRKNIQYFDINKTVLE